MKTKTQSVKPGDLFRNTLNGDIYYIIHFAMGIAPTPFFFARKLVFDEKNKKVTFNRQLVYISLDNFESRRTSKRVIKKISEREYMSWPSWRKHLDQVPESLVDLDQLAISFSRLDYKALCHFLFMLSVCISKEAKEDKRRKRPQLAFNLENTSSHLLASGQHSFLASMICEKKKDLP